MSRIGYKVIEVPEGVEVSFTDDNKVTVKGKNGELTRQLSPEIGIKQEGNTIEFTRDSDDKVVRSLHGTTRSLVQNMIDGVSKGFTKALELVGVGYRAQMQGKKLVLNVGLSHPVEFEGDENTTIETPAQDKIIIKGISKEAVGALAANIRSTRVPEPYKGKGIRYEGEHVRRKEGKTGK